MKSSILVVEDDPVLNQLLVKELRKAGYELDSATSWQQARERVVAFAPDLVLLDVMMPGKTGFEVCQEVRADPALDGVRILMLTAKGRENDISKGMALGANAYMTKPFSTRDLVQKVAEMLEGAA